MKIIFKLFASLTDYLPAQGREGNLAEIEVEPSASVSQIIESFGLPAKQVHLVLLNGRYIDPMQRHTQTLVEGDALAIWPPIAGG